MPGEAQPIQLYRIFGAPDGSARLARRDPGSNAPYRQWFPDGYVEPKPFTVGALRTYAAYVYLFHGGRLSSRWRAESPYYFTDNQLQTDYEMTAQVVRTSDQRLLMTLRTGAYPDWHIVYVGEQTPPANADVDAEGYPYESAAPLNEVKRMGNPEGADPLRVPSERAWIRTTRVHVASPFAIPVFNYNRDPGRTSERSVAENSVFGAESSGRMGVGETSNLLARRELETAICGMAASRLAVTGPLDPTQETAEVYAPIGNGRRLQFSDRPLIVEHMRWMTGVSHPVRRPHWMYDWTVLL